MKKYKVVKEINVKNQDITYYVVIGNKKHTLLWFQLDPMGSFRLIDIENKIRDKYKNINYHIDIMTYKTIELDDETSLMKVEIYLNFFYEDNTASTEIITIYEER